MIAAKLSTSNVPRLLMLNVVPLYSSLRRVPLLARLIKSVLAAAISSTLLLSQAPIPGTNAETLAAAVTERGHRDAVYAGDLATATERRAKEVREGDVVLLKASRAVGLDRVIEPLKQRLAATPVV